MLFARNKIALELTTLASRGVLIGTSSWKYPGWRGLLYTDDRYVWRGRFAESRFERLCLAEYAEVFKTVSVDASFYQFPTSRHLEELRSQVPADFLFAMKVTDTITLKRFPQLARFGTRAGQPNPDFLNAERFRSDFLGPCESVRANIGVLMFEFGRFQSADFGRGREFVEALDEFLALLPRGWPYGVEIRNRNFLQPEYFKVLAKYGVAHVLNSWEAMPPVQEQSGMPGIWTSPSLRAARFLLRPGRGYETAVKMFQPYNQARDVFQEGREAVAQLIQTGQKTPGRTMIYVNNRFEGCALETIAAALELAELNS